MMIKHMSTPIKRNAGRNILAIVLAAVLVLGVLPFTAPLTAYAASTATTIDVSDSTTTSGTNWTYAGGVFTVTGDVTITGTTTANRVVVQSGTAANITLNGANIDVSATMSACAFNMTGATVNLTLVGENTLKSGELRAGLQAPTGSVLTINAANDATDKLTANGGIDGAGIGGGRGGDGGNITINGGTVTATGNYGAGIGGGSGGDGGTITINGGTITATGANGGTGIGGGIGGAGGTITINGGAITAKGGAKGAGIGGGDGAITINGGDINATGGNYAAGIGGGLTSAGGTITINGGTVTANGGTNGAGIGGGQTMSGADGASGDITITNGATITANGGAGDTGGGGAGIGSGGSYGSVAAGTVGTIIIETGSNVTATGGSGATGNGANIGAAGGNGSSGVATSPGTTITYRTVTVTQTTGGTIAPFPNPSATNVVSGANQTYTITPSAGYKIASVTVDGVDVGAVTSWTIPNITTNTRRITAAFTLIPTYGVSLSQSGTYTFTGVAYGYTAQSPLTVTATNTGNASTGTLSVALSGTNAGSFTLSDNDAAAGINAASGTATFKITPNTGLGVGTYTATVTVSGNNSISASFSVSFTVGLGTQKTLTLVGLGTTYAYGGNTFQLSTSGGSGGGAVTYTSSAPTVASVQNDNPSADMATVTILKAGTFTITAVKATDGVYSATFVTSESVTVNKATPNVNLGASGGAVYGDDITLTATVSTVGTGATPSGTVTFKDGTTTLGTGTLDSFGVATYTDISPSAGSHSYTVEYPGETDLYNANSASVSHGVGTPTTTVYSVLTHFGTWTGSGTSSARVDADHTKFTRLLYGGAVIAPSNYTITQGSTIITLSEAHLKTYANGTHWFVLEYSDGTSENIRLDVNVAAASTPATGIPQTGDDSNMAFLWVALICAALGMLCLIVWRRRQWEAIDK